MFKKIAVIVEWDNARLSDVDRAREMLRRLTDQAEDVAARSLHIRPPAHLRP